MLKQTIIALVLGCCSLSSSAMEMKEYKEQKRQTNLCCSVPVVPLVKAGAIVVVQATQLAALKASLMILDFAFSETKAKKEKYEFHDALEYPQHLKSE